MNFLAPMFLIGAAGIAIPIVLHLIRRQAKNRQEFSSLMFLDPSPPTLMQRSRIDQWVLLLLRALALLLLAAAFARPYWNSPALTEESRPELRRAILLDTSASMQRDGVWPKAIESIKATIRTVQPSESLALYAFDDRVRTLVSHQDSMSSPPSERVQKVLAALNSIQPTSRGTDLGLALATVGDQLMRTEENDKANLVSSSEIILVSDFQAGSQIDRLENYQWPTQCKLTVQRIEAKPKDNVSASILVSKDENLATQLEPKVATPASKRELAKDSLGDRIAVRLSNYGGQSTAKVKLKWLDAIGHPVEGEMEVDAEVPASGSTVVRIAKQDSEAVRLHLEGDGTPFDNERYVATPPKRGFEIVCLDREQREATESLGYFLKQLPLGDETRDVKFAWREPGSDSAWPEKNSTPLVVVSHDLTNSDATKLKMFIEQGGHGLWVMDRPLDDASVLANTQTTWQTLTGALPGEFRESKIDRDAMFEEIDFNHPLFRSLADSRFNDFTKIRFWKHRCIALDEDTAWTTIARYDDSFPVIAYRKIGDGTLWLMTSGWQPSESQLALSSKFVPILSAIFALAAPAERTLDSIVVGDKIECVDGERWIDKTSKPLNVEVDKEGKRSVIVDELGFYQIERDGQLRWVAANLPAAESDTAEMEIERLERLGVLTSDTNSTQLAIEKKAQLHGVELEGQQRVWRWLMIGMLGVIVVETIWGIRGQQLK